MIAAFCLYSIGIESHVTSSSAWLLDTFLVRNFYFAFMHWCCCSYSCDRYVGNLGRLLNVVSDPSCRQMQLCMSKAMLEMSTSSLP